MTIKKIGSQGLEVSQIGLGCMGMSEFYGHPNDTESEKAIKRAYDRGIIFFDTSDMYGPYKNEILVGKALRDIRKKVVIATKFGIMRTDDPKVRGVNGRPEYVKSSCDGSLKRLGTDYIDLYYLHRVDPNTPIEETVGAMAELVKAGKVKYIGLSEASVSTLRRAQKEHPITALQSEYSLWTRDPEDEILRTVKELGIGFTAYSPLGRGFLTGRFKSIDDLDEDDYRRHSPRFQGENFEKNLQLADKINEIAKKRNIKPSQLALAWVINQGDFIFPIPGSTKINHIEENIEAASITLSSSELEQIDELIPKGAASGPRYPEHMMKSVNR
ncbi:MAG: aldo/keto reductase [Ignavibacteriaceae bacterium]|nr:aldo/keto reductase [Ignavibacteriaceae bacterium]